MNPLPCAPDLHGELVVGGLLISRCEGDLIVTHLDLRKTVYRAKTWRDAVQYAEARKDWTPRFK